MLYQLDGRKFLPARSFQISNGLYLRSLKTLPTFQFHFTGTPRPSRGEHSTPIPPVSTIAAPAPLPMTTTSGDGRLRMTFTLAGPIGERTNRLRGASEHILAQFAIFDDWRSARNPVNLRARGQQEVSPP